MPVQHGENEMRAFKRLTWSFGSAATKAALFCTVSLSALAIAATLYGPFYVADLGPAYMDTTLDGDSQSEYDAAQQLQEYILRHC